MRILIVTPAARGDRGGNRVTALRWAAILRSLGHRVRIAESFEDQPCDALIALHARKSHASILKFRERGGALIVALTGTDIYGEHTAETRRSFELADRIVALEPRAIDRLEPHLRRKARAIFQSATPAPANASEPQIAVIGNLRAVKDPFRAAHASRLLPQESKIRIVHAGAALEPEIGELARTEERENPRYRWLGSISRRRVRALIAESRALVLSSFAEGGANVVAEAIASNVPVLASRIDGTIGQLGEDYPAYFATEDTRALAELMRRVEADPSLFRDHAARLAPLFAPEREHDLWQSLIGELDGTRSRIRLIDLEPPRASFRDDVASGLGGTKKRLSCTYFYDEAGSKLFEDICQLDEYYIPRAEREILEAHRKEIVSLAPIEPVLIELGSGDAAKTRLLIDAFQRRYGRVRYRPIDISKEALEASSRSLLADFAGLEIDAIAGDYDQVAAQLGADPKLILFLGSNIGNFDRPDAARFLAKLRGSMAPSDLLLVGIDLRKDRAILEPAYDDSKGVTAAFNLNLLARINANLGGNFDLSAFAHRAEYQEEEGRIAMYLESLRPQSVRIAALDMEVRFVAGERIHTEYSYKYSPKEIEALALQAGLHVVRTWTDPADLFSSTLLRA
jgi:L-histidine Nalpha-methyltransferase